LIAQGNNVKGHNTVRHEHVWLALERNQAVINIKIIDIKLCMSLIEIQSKMTTLLCSQAIFMDGRWTLCNRISSWSQ